ncbi:MAG: hypothetical protein HZB16_23015, partial [Armatimonadetes bacterium]|nr:hypothetical protein [Armatimonadota bacterium]
MRPCALLALLSAALSWAADAPPGADLIPLPLVLPGTTPLGEKYGCWSTDDYPMADPPDARRVLPMVPRSISQVALHRPVTSGKKAYAGSLDLITDGDKEAAETSAVELKAKAQWVRIDLGQPREIWDVVIW